MLFQGFPTQAEAIYGRCPNPLGPTFGNQKRSTIRVFSARRIGVVVGVMMCDE